MDIRELYTLLPLGSRLVVDGLSIGILLALLVKFRREIYDTIISIKSKEYGIVEIMVLAGPPLIAIGMVLSSLLRLDVSLLAVTLMGLYLVVDGIVEYLLETEGNREKHETNIRKVALVPFLQGLLTPNTSTFAFTLPALLALGFQWHKALFLSAFYSVVYLAGSFIHPGSVLLAVPGFLFGLFLLSLYVHVPKLLPEHLIKPVYGIMMLLLTLAAL